MNCSLRAFAALIAAAGSLTVGAGAAHAKTLDIVLLGDSYASGVGAGDSGDCSRSPRAWGEVFGELARAKGLTVNVDNAACGGSTVPQLADQVDAIDGEETDLVLMITGGNDTDVSGSVAACFLPVLAGPNTCRAALEPAIARAPGVQADLLVQLTAIRSRLRAGAKIVFASYPYLAPAQGFMLKTWFASYDSGAAIRRLGDALDASAIGAINTLNASPVPGGVTAQLVPTKARFVGHEPDPDPWHENPGRWIHELGGLYTLSDPYHPNVQGHRELAAAVMASAGPTGDFGVAQ